MGPCGARAVAGCMVGCMGAHDDWEDEGAWPDALKQDKCSMIPKPKAEDEAGLRPIGLLPYVYRVWMAIRKSRDAQTRWSLDIHDRTHAGAATLAARTRASIEVATYEGRHTLLAFPDRSKCYERVGHDVAGIRGLESGIQGRVANLILETYQGDRHVSGSTAAARQQWSGGRFRLCPGHP